jgi:hypothetical protein
MALYNALNEEQYRVREMKLCLLLIPTCGYDLVASIILIFTKPCFFVDGLGGAKNTYLYKAMLTTICS